MGTIVSLPHSDKGIPSLGPLTLQSSHQSQRGKIIWYCLTLSMREIGVISRNSENWCRTSPGWTLSRKWKKSSRPTLSGPHRHGFSNAKTLLNYFLSPHWHVQKWRFPASVTKLFSIPIRHRCVHGSYRFSWFRWTWFCVVTIPPPCEVRSSCLVNIDGNSGWSCLIRFVLCLLVWGQGAVADRVIIKSLSDIVATVQPESSECQNPLESEDTSHIARREFT